MKPDEKPKADPFPISRDPPEGGTVLGGRWPNRRLLRFPISRDPPEGGTRHCLPMLCYPVTIFIQWQIKILDDRCQRKL